MVAAAVVLLAPARPTIRERSSRVVAAMARVLLSARLEPGSGVCVKSSRRHRLPGASLPRHGRVPSRVAGDTGCPELLALDTAEFGQDHPNAVRIAQGRGPGHISLRL